MILELLAMTRSAPRRFSSIPYAGTDAVRTLSVDVDATAGGLTILKALGAATAALFDTVRGASQRGRFASNEDVFSTIGFSGRDRIFTGANYNASPTNYVAWNFVKQALFLDIVPWTGRGSPIAHSLGETPALVLTLARTNSASDERPILWVPGDTSGYVQGPSAGDVPVPFSAVSSTHFTPDATAPNEVYSAAGTYVAYLFGTGSSNIAVGTWTGNGAGARSITLPWTPSWTAIWEADIAAGSNVLSGVYDVKLGASYSFLTGLSATTPTAWTTTTTLNVGTDMNASGIKYRYWIIR